MWGKKEKFIVFYLFDLPYWFQLFCSEKSKNNFTQDCFTFFYVTGLKVLMSMWKMMYFVWSIGFESAFS